MTKSVIYKYPLHTFGTTIVKVPGNSQFLSVKTQDDEVVAYFLLHTDTTLPETHYTFYSVGTGQPFVNEGMEMIDTVMLNEDRLVLHIFKM